MACGDRYRHLLVTSPSGLTVDAPFGTGLDAEVAGPGDYLEWYRLAESLAARARKAFLRLGEIEQKRGTFPIWNSLVDRSNDLRAAIDALPYPFLQLSPGLDVIKARDASIDAVCLLDLADQGIENYGGTPDPTPGPPGAGKLDLLTLALIGGALWLTVGGGAKSLMGGDDDG